MKNDKDDRFANMFMFQTGMTQEQYAQEQKEIAVSKKPSSLGQLKSLTNQVNKNHELCNADSC